MTWPTLVSRQSGAVIGFKGFPFPNYHFDYIVCNHTLTAIRFDDLPRALAEMRRVLKVGGVLRILVPNMELAFSYLDRGGLPNDFPVSPDLEHTSDGQVLRYIFWHGDARSAFTVESLSDTLNRAGFRRVKACWFKQTYSTYPEIVDLDSREAEPIITECVK